MEAKELFTSNTKTEESRFNTSKQNYENAAEQLGSIIREIFDSSIPEQTIRDWKILMVSILIVDHRLDNIVKVEERLKLNQKIASSLKGDVVDFSDDKDLESAMSGIRDLSYTLGEDQRKFFHNSLLRILKITEKIKVEENLHNFVELTRLEGQITAKILLSFIPEEFKLTQDYHKLMHALTRFFRAANSLDTFIDLPIDYENKQAKVTPTIYNRVRFLSVALSDTLSMLKDTKLSKLKDLGKLFFVSIKKAIKYNQDKQS